MSSSLLRNAEMLKQERIQYLENALRQHFEEVQTVSAHHCGYPTNLGFGDHLPFQAFSMTMINVGNPETSSFTGPNATRFEKEIVQYVKSLWECDPLQNVSGYVTGGSTEAIISALLVARDNLSDPVVLMTKDTHYSGAKACHIVNLREVKIIKSSHDGTMNLSDLKTHLTELKRGGRKVTLLLTCGTTMEQGHDSGQEILEILQSLKFARDQYYVHLDAAFSGFTLPYLANVPDAIKPSFRHGFDSISASFHKAFGVPRPSGIILVRSNTFNERQPGIQYLNSEDTTITGCRSGISVLDIWVRLFSRDRKDIEAAMELSLSRTKQFLQKLLLESIPARHSAFSFTVVFPAPSAQLSALYQLAQSDNVCHVIVLPMTREDALDNLLSSYVLWWKGLSSNEQAQKAADMAIS